jgi:hypothetical protein
MEGELAF